MVSNAKVAAVVLETIRTVLLAKTNPERVATLLKIWYQVVGALGFCYPQLGLSKEVLDLFDCRVDEDGEEIAPKDTPATQNARAVRRDRQAQGVRQRARGPRRPSRPTAATTPIPTAFATWVTMEQ